MLNKLKKVKRQSIVNLFMTIAGIFFSFLSVKLFSINYDQLQFGLWNIYLSLVAWYLVIDFGLIQAYQNFIIKKRVKGAENSLSNEFFGLTIVMLVLSLMVFFLIYKYSERLLENQFNFSELEYHKKFKWYFIYFLFISAIGSALRIGGAVLRSIHLSELVGIQNLIKGFVPILLMVFFGEELIEIPYFLVTIGTIFFLVDIAFYITAIKLGGINYKGAVFKGMRTVLLLAAPSISFFIYQIGYHFIELTPTLYSASYIGIAEAGKFGPTIRMYALSSGLAVVLLSPFITFYGEIFHSSKNEVDIKGLAVNQYKFMLMVGGGAGLGYSIFAPMMLYYWLGERYTYNPLIYNILGASLFFNVTCSFIIVRMVGMEEYKSLSAIYAFAGLFCFLISTSLGLSYKTLGIALAILVTNITTLGLLLLNNKLNYSYKNHFKYFKKIHGKNNK